MRHDAGGVTAASREGHPERVEEEEALAGLDVVEVADPEPVRLRPCEGAVDEVGCRGPLRITHRRA